MRMFFGLLWLLLAGPAAAHLTPNSEVNLDFGRDGVRADVIVPLGEYGFASANPVANTAAARAAAAAWLTESITVRSPDGRDWGLRIERLEFKRIAGPPDLHALVWLTPPPGATARAMTIHWRAVIDVVPGHFALFVARSDFGSGQVAAARQVLGALQGEHRLLRIDRGSPSLWAGFRAAVQLGMVHIAEGRDHMLFLIALLLPAPVLAVAWRWQGVRPARAMAWHLAGIVTAFTVGHSLTLVASAAFQWHLPAQPVEVAIAASILIAAIHAWRPIFAGREALVAGSFGLVHGLAFATVIGPFGLGWQERALTIAGFNIGIELVQLAVVAVLALPLLMLARGQHYRRVQSGGALLAGVAALGWLVERISETPNMVVAGVDMVLAQPFWLLAGLTLWGLIDWQSRRALR